MKNESVKKSLEKSKNVLEKRKNGQAKNLHKKSNTFSIISKNFVHEQLTIFLNKLKHFVLRLFIQADDLNCQGSR